MLELAAPNDGSAPWRLLLFGDSWTHQDGVRTWPQVLGDNLGWPTLNLGADGTLTEDLDSQFDELQARLQRTGARVHEDAWVLVHSGGNDLMETGFEDPFETVRHLLVRSTPPVMGIAIQNLRKLVARCRRELGISNVILVGIPCSQKMPGLKYGARLVTENKAAQLWLKTLGGRCASLEP